MSSPLVRKSASKTDWTATFPIDLEIEKSSAAFVHRLINVSTAFILDKRSILSDECFKTRTIEKLLVAAFNRENPNAKRLFEKISALKTAIQEKYLREFAIVFYKTPDEEDILEVYSFGLNYNEDDVGLTLDTGIGCDEFSQNIFDAKFESLEQTKALFVNTMKKLHRLIKNLEDLPKDADASFRLSFTDAAPLDYMPEGYKKSNEFYKLDSSCRSLELGTLSGGHHKVQLLAASTLTKGGRIVDLNQTSVSMNQSIFATPTNKRKSSEKTNGEKRGRPYGQARPMSTMRRQGAQLA